MDNSCHSIETQYFPLEALLKLYGNLESRNHGPNRLYLNYFEEFKLLVKFLGPFSYTQPKRMRKLPWFAGSYQLQELSRHLRMDQNTLYSILCEMYEGED
jgi:hypothetical protein